MQLELAFIKNRLMLAGKRVVFPFLLPSLPFLSFQVFVAEDSRASGCQDGSGHKWGTSAAENAWEEPPWEPDYALLSKAMPC